MMAPTTASESTPLIEPQPPSSLTAKAPKNVTFSSTVSSSASPVTQSAGRQLVPPAPSTGALQDGRQPVLSALNSKLRRRHSSGAPLGTVGPALPKAGAQRTTKTAEKLKLLPDPDEADPDEESGRDVYSQFTRIKDPTARRDAARLGKDDRDKLPRVTAYCTANAYRLDDLMKFLRGKGKTRGSVPKLFDECIYTPYNYGKSNAGGIEDPRIILEAQRRYSDSAVEVDGNNESLRDDLIALRTEGAVVSIGNEQEAITNKGSQHMRQQEERREDAIDFDTQVHTPEVFLFNYGTVVIWGMTVQEEQRFLKDIAKFETEKLSEEDIQAENFNFYYTREYQARIYNDFISLREKRSYMTKLAISHALSQSVKTSLYEDLVDNTIETTKEIPSQIATTGKVDLSRREINMQIGELFILRINIHLQGSVLDSPELMWTEPQLDPVYQAVRSYLEMDQRVGLLTERLEVIADLLAVLKDQLTHTHGEYLEWIVIILIAAEILVAFINILVDLYAGEE